MKSVKKYMLSCIIAMIMICIATILFITGKRNDADKYQTVAFINGEPIALGEFRLFLQDQEANTAQYFFSKYGVEDQKGFWTNNFNGEIPRNVAKQKALEVLKKIKLEQILMKQNNVVDDIGYRMFLKQLLEENNLRKKPRTSRSPVYGLNNFGEIEYYKYLHSSRLYELMKVMGEKDFKATDEELNRYFILLQADGAYKISEPHQIFDNFCVLKRVRQCCR